MIETMYETIVFIGLLVMTQVIKKHVIPKYGEWGLHGFVFLVAVAFLGVKAYADRNLEFKEVLVDAGIFLASAVSLYELILSKVGFKSVTEQLTGK